MVDAGKTPVAWHEMGSAANIAEGTVGQYWGKTTPEGAHAEEAAHFVERGGALIMSAADVTYLDMKYTEDFPLGLTWAAIIDVRSAYEWEPTAVLDVPDAAILGVEAPLWSETRAHSATSSNWSSPAWPPRRRWHGRRSTLPSGVGVLQRAGRSARPAVEG